MSVLASLALLLLGVPLFAVTMAGLVMVADFLFPLRDDEVDSCSPEYEAVN
jgi:hypothetical protein